MKITLPHYKCPSWNKLYSGRHWSVRSEMAAYAHQSVKEALMGQKWVPYTSPVAITVIARLKRMIDPDNVCAKLLIDGIKTCGLIKDDTPAFVSQVTTRVEKAKDDHTCISLDAV